MLNLLKKTFWLIRCGSWPVFIVIMCIWLSQLGMYVREYAFENLCHEAIRHPKGISYEGVENYVTWCATWWWHPLGAITRAGAGVLGGLLICLLSRLWVSRSTATYAFNAVFASLISTAYASYMIVEPFKYFIWRACMFNYDEYKTVCDEQLGTLGDQRFFMPIALCLTLWIAFFSYKRKSNNNGTGPKNLRPTFSWMLKTSLFFAVVGGFIGSTIAMGLTYTLYSNDSNHMPITAIVAGIALGYSLLGFPVAAFAGFMYSVLRNRSNKGNSTLSHKLWLGLTPSCVLTSLLLLFNISTRIDLTEIAYKGLFLTACTLITVYLHSQVEERYTFFKRGVIQGKRLS